jgi:pSer/pThr/pTyr-binding forkhead associated (FHA) protein
MASLQVLKGGKESRVIPLDGNLYILGRNPDCTIVLPGLNSVSRYHARITRVNDRYYIEDGHFDQNGQLLEPSRNKTLVNDKDIDKSRVPLRNND